MRPGRFLITAFVCLGLADPVRAAQPSDCWTRGEAEAQSVRALQTLLMVAALQCRARSELGLVAGYNRIMRQHGAALASQGDALRQRFARVHGPGWQVRFDRYLTQLANQFAAVAQVPAFCDQAAGVAARALEAPPGALPAVAREASAADDLDVCVAEGGLPR